MHSLGRFETLLLSGLCILMSKEKKIFNAMEPRKTNFSLLASIQRCEAVNVSGLSGPLLVKNRDRLVEAIL